MTKLRGGHQQGGLHLISLDSFYQFWQQVIDNTRRVRNKSAQTPANRIELTNNSVLLKFEQALERQLRIEVLLYGCGIVAPRCKLQVRRFHIDWYFPTRELA